MIVQGISTHLTNGSVHT